MYVLQWTHFPKKKGGGREVAEEEGGEQMGKEQEEGVGLRFTSKVRTINIACIYSLRCLKPPCPYLCACLFIYFLIYLFLAYLLCLWHFIALRAFYCNSCLSVFSCIPNGFALCYDAVWFISSGSWLLGLHHGLHFLAMQSKPFLYLMHFAVDSILILKWVLLSYYLWTATIPLSNFLMARFQCHLVLFVSDKSSIYLYLFSMQSRKSWVWQKSLKWLCVIRVDVWYFSFPH